MKNTKNIMLVLSSIVIFLLLIVIGFMADTYGEEIKSEKAKQEILQKDLQEAEKPSELEQITENIQIANEDKKLFTESREKAKQRYELSIKADEANTWYVRCLEANTTIIQREQEKNICPIYAILDAFGDFSIYGSEDDYKELQKYANYNLDNTLIELGLK